jgi:hypothetical protein
MGDESGDLPQVLALGGAAEGKDGTLTRWTYLAGVEGLLAGLRVLETAESTQMQSGSL